MLHWRYYLPKRFDFYVVREVIGPFFGGLVFFIFIFLMFQALRLMDLFISHGVSGWILGKLTLLLGLSFMPMALPIAFLIGVLVGFGRLSSDSELVALKASGIGVNRMALPVTLLAAGIVVLSIVLNMQWVPWGERTFKQLLIKVSNTKVVSALKEGTFTSGFFDLLIFADKVDPITNRLNRVFIFDEREAKNPLAVVAHTGELVQVKTESDLGAAAVLKLYDGSIHHNEISSNTYQKIGFGEYRLYLKIDEGADGAVTKPHMIPYDELVKGIQKSDLTTYEGRELRGEYWRRYAIALTPLLFVFVGIGFGTVRTRAVRAGATLIAFIILFIYWTIQAAGTVAVQRNLIPPYFAMQLPNLAILLIATIGFRRASW